MNKCIFRISYVTHVMNMLQYLGKAEEIFLTYSYKVV
jgi:hypothetical protein